MSIINNLTDLWNNGVSKFTAIKMDVTDTASDSDSLLLDLQVGSVSKFAVRKDGVILGNGGGQRSFDTLADLQADTTLTTTNTPAGTYVQAGNHRYKAVASGGDIANANGVSLDVLEGELGYDVGAFGALGDGTTDDTAAIAAASTAAQGSALIFVDGNYVNSATPADIDGVHCIGSPRVSFIGTSIPMFNGVYTGNSEIAIVAGVIRYYSSGTSGAGWYFLSDHSESHDPVLLGPVSASGTGSLILDVNLDALGLDPALWTPSGFVCGPDEGLAVDGVTFGASVGTSSITIYGSYNAPSPQYIYYDGAAWQQSGTAGYTLSWVAGATAYLEVTRPTSVKKSAWSASTAPILQMRVDNTTSAANFLSCALSNVTADNFRVTFQDATGANVAAANTYMKFYVHDPALRNASFIFSTDPGSTKNIWMVGVFRRKPSGY